MILEFPKIFVLGGWGVGGSCILSKPQTGIWFLTWADQIGSFVHGFYLPMWKDRGFFFSSLLFSFFLFFLNVLKNRRMAASKAVCLVNKHPAFSKKKLCNTGTGIPQLQLERHRASPWDLYLAFAMLLIKYFINNVNILDGERTVASHSICTAIATRCSAFICLGPMILKLFIAHVSFFNQSVFRIPCSRDLDKRINSASTS